MSKHPEGLRIVHVDPPHPKTNTWEHGIIWHGVHSIAIALDDLHWYGGGGLVHQRWPLEKLAQYSAPFITSDNGATGLLGILHPFWWASNGAGILVESDAMQVGFNAPLTGQPFPHSFDAPAPMDQRPQLANGLKTDGLLRVEGKDLQIRFFNCENARRVVEAHWSLINISPPPPRQYLEKPLWTTWAYFKNDISHEKVVGFAQDIIKYGFTCSVLGIDAKWQEHFGDTHFDSHKFPDPQATIDALQALGVPVTLWCIPFYNPESEHFQPAVEQGYATRCEDGTPCLRDWWEGRAALLDVANPAAMQWHLANLKHLQSQFGFAGYKFDAGEGMFYETAGLVPNPANHLYIEQVSRHYPWSDVRSGWRNQSQSVLFRQWDKSTSWGFDNGLASCITQAIMLNMLGYPFNFPDMIGGNQYWQSPTAELMIRWTQAVAPMPIIQFSIPPWVFGEEATTICHRYTQLHSELADRHLALAAKRVPIVRPLWWLSPNDEEALVCEDTYLIGDDLLVAPVLEDGARQRDIYLPLGRWHSYWNPAEVYEGSQWLRNYPAPLNILPLFEREVKDEFS